jgi:hypothetical protein
MIRMLLTLVLCFLATPALAQPPIGREPFPTIPRPSPFPQPAPRPSPQLPPITANRAVRATIPKNNWKVVFVDSQAGTHPAVQAIDGDAATLWASEWDAAQPPFPHEIQINLGAVYPISGFEFTPRQDGWTDGYLLNYEFYVSSDGKDWGEPLIAGTFTTTDLSTKKTLTAPTTRAGQFIRFRGLGDVAGGNVMVVAELDIVEGTLPGYVTMHVLGPTLDKNTVEPLASRTTALNALSPLCNLPYVDPPTEAAVVNPTFATFDDPFHANRLCRVELPRDIPIGDTSRVVAIFRAAPPIAGDNEIIGPRSNVAIPQPWFRAGIPPPATPASVRILP